MADSHLVRPKKQPKNKTDQKNNRIVGQMWLSIFCRTYLCFTRRLGSTLLGMTASVKSNVPV